jgi:predicted nucleotidyltransferase
MVLTHRRPEIERVLLFGSLATGRAVPGSDADLLMILTHSDLPFLSRIPRYMPEGCGIAVDVFPYTHAEIEAMQAADNHFLKRALAEGLEIFSYAEPGQS